MKTIEKKYLNPVNRTPEIKSYIDSEFYNPKNLDYYSSELENGDNNYNIFIVSEKYTLQHLINNHQEKKDFYILDVGAGNFQCAQNQAKFINEQIARQILPKDISVNFISIRSECNYGEKFLKTGNCNLYNLGSFKIEDLAKELQSNYLLQNKLSDLTGKFDLILSSDCLRHLVDPLGTFIQMHDALKDSGLMLTDNFEFKIAKHDLSQHCVTKLLIGYLQCAGDNILVQWASEAIDFLRIAVEKHSNIKIPFNYIRVAYDRVKSLYSEKYVINEPLTNKVFSLVSQAINEVGTFAGNEVLFQELKQVSSLERKDLLAKEKFELLSSILNNDAHLQDKYNQYFYTKEVGQTFNDYDEQQKYIKKYTDQLKGIKKNFNVENESSKTLWSHYQGTGEDYNITEMGANPPYDDCP